jgi:hypothetical protein
LLAVAVGHAVAHGAAVVEGYPVDPAQRPRAGPADLYHGTLKLFLSAGFTVVSGTAVSGTAVSDGALTGAAVSGAAVPGRAVVRLTVPPARRGPRALGQGQDHRPVRGDGHGVFAVRGAAAVR